MHARLRHEFRIEAAHRLPRVAEGHRCARLHGHSFRIEIALHGIVEPDSGWVMDFDRIAAAWAPVHESLDHRYLNDVAGLDNPTSENLARWIWEKVAPMLPGLARVTIWETCETACEYEGDGDTAIPHRMIER